MSGSTSKAAAVLAAAAGLAMGRQALAQADAALSWNNAAGGAASTTTNWAPNQMPVATDDLSYNLLANYSVTYSNLVPSSRTQTFKRGSVTLTMSSPHTTSTGITVGDLNGDLATATLTTGTWNSGGPITIGDAAGSNGTLAVNDDDADLLMTGATSDMIVGSNAPGTLSITGGGLVQVADQFIAGNNAAGTSTVTVSGATAALPLVRSTLRVLGTGVSSKFGQGGDATVNISNGALVDFAGDLVVSNGSASTSTVTVAGQGGIVPQNATLDIAGDLLLGRNTSAGAAAGTATMNIDASGRLAVGGTLFVSGDPDGGTGTLHMAAGGQITTRSLDVGVGTTLDLVGGALTIDGGTLSNSNPASALIFGGTAQPVITLVNNATASLSPVGGIALRVGSGAGSAVADFDVRSGSDLAITSGTVVIGDVSDDGSMIINGEGSTMTMPTGQALIVGNTGVGHFEAELGADVSGGLVFIASEVGSTGTVLFENAGTTAVYDSIFVGGNSDLLNGAGGTGDLIVNAQAVLNVNSTIKVWPDGLLDIRGSATANSGFVDVRGGLTLQNGGVLHGGSLGVNVRAGGIVRGHPISAGAATIDSPFTLQLGATLELVNGDLTIGSATDPQGFNARFGSTVSIGANHLTALDLDSADLGTVTIAGGTLTAPNGLNIVNNGTLDGTGTITTPELFFNSGGSVITATGAGITINGMLRNNSGNIDGTLYTFNGPSGGWTGAGAINARVVFNSGTQVGALAGMTMGDGSATGATFAAGTQLHAETHNITFLDSNGLGLPDITDMDGGTLSSVNGLVVNTGRVLRGNGDIAVTNGTLTIFGTIDPDARLQPSGVYADLGTFHVNGAYTQGVNSHYQFDTAGVDNEFRTLQDKIIATGPISLTGALDVSFILGYTGQAAHTFEVVVGSTRTGTFSSVTSPSTPFGPAHVVYLPDRARLILCYANCDGSFISPSLNVLDFSCFLNRFAAGESYANCDASTTPPVLNVLDFACFLNKFAAGCQ